MTYPKRLIEVDLPIARISAHARREKSIRHGHISTLHIWWARRPLAACRAVICAALWPDPADPNCPQAFRDAALRHILAFAKRVFPERINEEGQQLQETAESGGRWESLATGTLKLDSANPDDWWMLRMCLLDFIADFANWDNSTVRAYLETSRALTQAAHEALGGEPGTRPLVVDPFAGGGSIPLEALRVGADAFASDLNPVAVLLNKVVLEYVPKYGNADIRIKDAEGNDRTFKGLAEAVRYWGNWVKEQAEKELTEFYPENSDGSTPIAYLWARTILSEAPGEGEVPVEVPLIRSLWLCRKPNRKVALRWVRENTGAVETETVDVTHADGVTRRVRRPLMVVFEPKNESEVEEGTVARGSATCPVTGYTTAVQNVRSQLRSRRGGSADARLLARVSVSDDAVGRNYWVPTKHDYHAAERAAASCAQLPKTDRNGLTTIPSERFSGLEPRRIPIPQYGIEGFADLFTPRQQLALATYKRLLAEIAHGDSDACQSVATCLALVFDRLADKCASFVVWHNSAEKVEHVFGRQAIPMVWDFAEASPLSSIGWEGCLEWVVAAIRSQAAADLPAGHVHQVSAARHVLPTESAESVITDPPYYFSVPYADLSDFFYVWLRRVLGPTAFPSELTPKDEECIQNLPHSEVASRQKTRSFFESTMQSALTECRRILRPSGISVVVFAHLDTAAWETLVNAMVAAGWVVTGSWPLDTEMTTRLIAKRQSSLSSSIHLVCRPRKSADGKITESVGEWRDIIGELPRRIHEWMPRLAAEGVVGADAIFACLGPALEIFSRHSRVEKANGEAATLHEYLEFVWAGVATEAMSVIFKEADAAGLEPDARLTAMWLWTIGGGTNGNGNGTSKSPHPGAPSPEEGGDGSDDGGATDEEEPAAKAGKATGYALEFDAARKIAQGLGVHLEKSESIVEVKGDKARLLSVAGRTRHLFGGDAASSAPAGAKRRKKEKQRTFFEELGEAEAAEAGWGDIKGPPPGSTVLDRLHQAMILFGAGRGELMKRFLVDDGVGKDPRFWKLAQSLAALYPKGTDERRWVEGVLARKKGLGL